MRKVAEKLDGLILVKKQGEGTMKLVVNFQLIRKFSFIID